MKTDSLKHKQAHADVLDYGLPTNAVGNIQEELLILPQFLEEYVCSPETFLEEVEEGRLKILTRDLKTLVARTDANNWALVSVMKTQRKRALKTIRRMEEEMDKLAKKGH